MPIYEPIFHEVLHVLYRYMTLNDLIVASIAALEHLVWHLELLWQRLGPVVESLVRSDSQHRSRVAEQTKEFRLQALLGWREVLYLSFQNLIEAQLRPPPLDKIRVFLHPQLDQPQLLYTRQENALQIIFLLVAQRRYLAQEEKAREEP